MGQPSPAHVSVYDPGDMVTLRGTFVSTDLVTPADPSVVTFFVKDPWTPAGSPTGIASYVYGQAAASVVRAGVGAYWRDFQIPYVASAAGDWQYVAQATGLVQAVQPWSFRVATSLIL